AQYIMEMRHVQPVGPYSILGYSFGGAIAFEMAQQLVACRESVAFLGFLDSGFPGCSLARDVSFIERMLLHARTMAHRGSMTRLAAYVWRRIGQVWIRTGRRLRRAMHSTPPSPSDDALQKVVAANKGAWLAYVPRMWHGPLTMFAGLDLENIWGDSRSRWAEVIDGKLDVVWVPGTHGGVLEPPHVSILAQAMNDRLRRSRVIGVEPGVRAD
ncbi:MAG: thioesterase domain-containing protein, partial [Caldiserica bacterium]|nr:thioesterase domain-containing protein [Caldisericota bacterium]